MNRLYPLKFKSIIKEKIWGGTKLKTHLCKKTATDKAGESWEISGYPGEISRVKNGFLAGNNLEELIEVYMGDLVGDSVFEQFGTVFPLLIKFIHANNFLSIQVHPDDEMARKHLNSFGKTEMWYVLEAEKNAEIIVGFNRKVDKNTYLDHLKSKTLMQIMNKEKTYAGDVFFIPAGRIHSIGAGILLAEIQQTSDATLRIYDFDRVGDDGKPRPLHTELAVEAMDYNYHAQYKTPYEKVPNQSNKIVQCRYFTTNLLELTRPVEKDYAELDSFVIYICIEGAFAIHYYEKEKEIGVKGETILLPAEIKNVRLVPEPYAQILEVYIETVSSQKRANEVISKFF
jgi:mannose-6-phosphate isomerase